MVHEVCFEQETQATSSAACPTFSRHQRASPGTYLVSQPSLSPKAQKPLQRPFPEVWDVFPANLASYCIKQMRVMAFKILQELMAQSMSSPSPMTAGMRPDATGTNTGSAK